MISDKDIKSNNANLAMITKETPALDLTRQFVGYTPRSRFKQGYMKSLKKTDSKLMEYIDNNYRYDKPDKLVPYLYDARRRGLSVPEYVQKHYNVPDEGYLRELNVISGEPAEKYVNTSMAMAGAMTGYAVLDWLQDVISNKNPVAKKGWTVAGEAPKKLYAKAVGERGAEKVINATSHNLSTVLGGHNPKTSKLVERLLGSAHSIPTLGLAALPLMSRRVIKPMKGEDKESKRYKTFDWIERNPAKTMGIAYSPAILSTLIGGGYDVASSVKDMPSGIGAKATAKGIAGSAGRTGLTLGKLGLTAAVPLMFMNMRRNMTDATDKEQALINSKIVKNINQGSEKQ